MRSKLDESSVSDKGVTAGCFAGRRGGAAAEQQTSKGLLDASTVSCARDAIQAPHAAAASCMRKLCGGGGGTVGKRRRFGRFSP